MKDFCTDIKLLSILCIIFPCIANSQNVKSKTLCTSDTREDNGDHIYDQENAVKKQSELIEELSQRIRIMETTIQKDGFPQERMKISGQFGRKFILSFPEIHTVVRKIQLLLVSTEDGSVCLDSRISGVNQSAGVTAKEGLTLNLPTSLARAGSYIGYRTVTIRSSVDIAVSVVQLGQSGTGDGYMAIPEKSLKKKYYFAMDQNAMLSTVSFYDDTCITITSSTGTAINLGRLGLSNGDNVTLTTGQVLQIKHHNWVMGHVESSKPFMFLHGSYTDPEYSELESVIDSVLYTVGQFFIIPFISTKGTPSVTFCNEPERRPVVSNEKVRLTPHYLYMNAIQKVVYIKADFNTSCTYIGHGFSVSIPPVSAFGTYCRYITPYGSNFTHHAVVLSKAGLTGGIKFRKINYDVDIQPDHRETINVSGESYSALYHTISDGQYEVWNDNKNATFGMIAYGFGIDIRTAYGFPVCFR